MNRLGTVHLQSSDKSDVFRIADVYEDGITTPDEAMMLIEDSQFDSDKAWVTGHVPKMWPVQVEGDNPLVQAWFKGEQFSAPFRMTIYIEVELAEEFVEARRDEEITDEEALV